MGDNGFNKDQSNNGMTKKLVFAKSVVRLIADISHFLQFFFV